MKSPDFFCIAQEFVNVQGWVMLWKRTQKCNGKCDCSSFIIVSCPDRAWWQLNDFLVVPTQQSLRHIIVWHLLYTSMNEIAVRIGSWETANNAYGLGFRTPRTSWLQCALNVSTFSIAPRPNAASWAQRAHEQKRPFCAWTRQWWGRTTNNKLLNSHQTRSWGPVGNEYSVYL